MQEQLRFTSQFTNPYKNFLSNFFCMFW